MRAHPSVGEAVQAPATRVRSRVRAFDLRGLVPALWIGLVATPLQAQPPAGQDTTGTDTTTVPDAPAATDSGVPDQPGGVAGDTVPSGEPVVFGGDTLFRLRGRIGPFGPTDRARAVEARLDSIAEDPVLSADTFRVASGEGGPEIVLGERTVLAVTPGDAQGFGVLPEVLATAWAATLQASIAENAQRAGVQRLLLAVGGTLVALGILVVLLYALGRFFPVLYRFIRLKGQRLPAIRVQRLELVSKDVLVRSLITAARVLRTALTLLLVLGFTPLVLGLFPATQGLSRQLTSWIFSPLRLVGGALVAYLPNLFSIAVILVVTWYGLKLVKVVFDGLDRGTLHLPGFYQDWAAPTYQIIRVFVVVLTIILIWPYLPNSDSDAFRGVAAFVGLLLTFGSASAVANVVGGVVMIYMRPFQIGDRVKISDTVGDVVRKSLLVTRIRTTKRVEITIPNSMVLSSHIVNYSAAASDDGIILHTAVTIGYDVPWRKVQRVMISAAEDIDGILDRPPPFVLQTALGDYAVTYELNAYTDRPGRMAVLYSRLHEALQDRFAEADIEIMSPAYHALRDGPSTVPTLESTASDVTSEEEAVEQAMVDAALEEAARAEESIGQEARAELEREQEKKAQAVAEAASAAKRVLDRARAALASDEEEENGKEASGDPDGTASDRAATDEG